LYADIQSAKQELMEQGYQKILTLWPAQMIMKEIDGKYGFYTLIANNQAEELKQLIANKSLDCQVEAGRIDNVVVTLIIMKDPENHAAIFCPLNYLASDEQKIRQKSKDGLYVFFRILTGEIVGSLRFDNLPAAGQNPDTVNEPA